MHSNYPDIMAIAQETKFTPIWWDENGVPRFFDHHPSLCPDIYADQVALLVISCQSCRKEFEVQMSSKRPLRISDAGALSVAIKDGSVHYGDPPWHDDNCSTGNSMSCWDLRVIQFWHRGEPTNYRWTRVHELEINLPDMKDPDR